jgi:hypothetical protein
MNIDHGVRNSIYRTNRAVQGFASLALPYNFKLPFLNFEHCLNSST